MRNLFSARPIISTQSLRANSTEADNLRFSYKFYIKSYPDIANYDKKSAKNHFLAAGIQENRYCSSYHFFKENKPEYAGCVSIRKFRKQNNIGENISPLEVCELILAHLTHGIPSEIDSQYFQSQTKRPSIAKHGQILPWLAQFNNSSTKVLEIGSRSVTTQAPWKNCIPDVQYTGIDIMDGDNVDLVADAHKLSEYFEEESFDFVISFAVFEHLAMPWIVAEEISKILKVGGYVAIETHFSFSEHELPWHFFQFNSNALECMFNESLGFNVIDSGLDTPMIGRFANSAPPYLRGNAIQNLYCHSTIIAQKNKSRNSKKFSWENALTSVLKNTMYPKNTGISASLNNPH